MLFKTGPQSFNNTLFQDDLFVDTLTPDEHLTFASKFIFKSRKSRKEISALVDELLFKMRLEKCRDTVIGSPRSA